jgi:hypothetical protein
MADVQVCPAAHQGETRHLVQLWAERDSCQPWLTTGVMAEPEICTSSAKNRVSRSGRLTKVELRFVISSWHLEALLLPMTFLICMCGL